MQSLLLNVDKVSTWVGQAFSWLIVALTLLISWEVFSRYALDHPHAVRRIVVLQQDAQRQAGRATTEDLDVHALA